MSRHAWMGVALTALACVLATAGCAKKTPFLPNQAPVTRVFLVGQVDTMTYRTRLFWSGDDPDGDVIGFELQFQPGTAAPVDAQWKMVPRALTDSTFALPIGAGIGTFTFYVRAVDDKGLRDPHPAHITLYLRNRAPQVAFINLPHRRQGGLYHFLPVLTLQWQGTDPDGPSTVARYHLWLDGGGFDTLLSASDTVFTLRMEHFGDVSTTRLRTVNVSVQDEAGANGDTSSFTWQVDAYTPGTPRVLLVDNYNPDQRFTVNNSPMDSLYRNAVSTLTGGQYSLLDLFDVDNFRFPQDVSELLRHFDLVVWYNESGATHSPGPGSPLDVAEPGLTSFLDRGGNFYLSGLSIVGGNSGEQQLSDDFHRNYLGVDSTFCFDPAQGECNYTLRPSNVLLPGNPAEAADSLAQPFGFLGFVDLFAPAPSTTTEFYLPAGSAADNTTVDHAAIVTHTLAGGGKVTFSSVPLYKLTRFGNRERVLARLLTGLSQHSAPRAAYLRHGRR